MINIASTIAAIIAANRRELVGVGVTTQRGQTTSDCYRRIPPPGASVHVANQDYLGRVVGENLEDDIRFLAVLASATAIDSRCALTFPAAPLAP
jgi:hypothetical protein